MKRFIRRNQHLIGLSMVLVFVSGCAGAVSKTAEQLSKDAVSPIVVPIEQGQKAKKTLDGVNADQEERNRAMDETAP
jgi:hypothetical protein